MRSLRLRIAVAIGLTAIAGAAVALGFVALELAEERLHGSRAPASAEYLELLLAMLPFAVIAPVVGTGVAVWSLRPVRQVADQARRIGPGHAGLRIAGEGLPLELLPLVDAVNDALDRLDRALRNERRLSADAAHALRTPIATLRLRLQQAEDGEPADLRGMRGDLDRLQRSVAQILSLARLDAEAEGSGPEGVGTDPGRLARSVIAELLPLAENAGRAITLDAPARAPRLRVPGLDEALRNLLHNALVHGAGTVRVAIAVDAARALALLSVEDEGAGVASGPARQALLAPFGRGEHSSGSGLGLAIAARIAGQAGGALIWPAPARLELRLPCPAEDDR